MWVGLTIIVAFLMSVQDVASKRALKKADAYVVTWGWWFFSLPFLYAYLPVEPLPPFQPGFIPVLVVSVVILVVAVLFYIKAIQASDLSLSVPMLTFTPLFLLVTSPLMLHEYPHPLGIVGVLMIVTGSYLLFFEGRHQGITAPLKSLMTQRGPRYMLLVALLFSVTGNMDKLGVVRSSAFAWILALNTAVSVVLTVIMLKKNPHPFAAVRSVWPLLAVTGFCNGLALVVQMKAITLTQVPYLIAIKRTSVVFSALYGFLVLKEQGLSQRLGAIVLMVAGVFLIAFS